MGCSALTPAGAELPILPLPETSGLLAEPEVLGPVPGLREVTRPSLVSPRRETDGLPAGVGAKPHRPELGQPIAPGMELASPSAWRREVAELGMMERSSRRAEVGRGRQAAPHRRGPSAGEDLAQTTTTTRGGGRGARTLGRC